MSGGNGGGGASKPSFRAGRRRRPPLLTLPQRLAAFLLLIVPVAVLGVRFFNDTEERLDAVLRQAAPLAEAELTRMLGREVRIGTLKPDLSVRTLLRDFLRRASLGVIPVEATDVALASGATFAASPTLASARRAIAFVSIPKLLAGRTNEAVERILLEEPYLLLVRDRTGRLNLQDLVQPRKGPPGKPFVTRVEVEQGTLRFVDFASRARGGNGGAQTNDLDRIDAAADVGARAIRFTASARGKPGTATARRLGGPVAAEGTFARGTPGQTEFSPGAGTARYLANVSARDADAAYWLDYFVGPQPTLGLRAARADARVTLLAPRGAADPAAAAKPPPARLSVDADVRQALLAPPALRGARVEQAQGGLRFADGALTLDARGRVLGEPVTVEGSVFGIGQAAGQQEPSVALRFSAPRIPLRRAVALAAELPDGVVLDGMGAAEGYVGGTSGDPVVVGTVRVPSLRVPGGVPGVSDIRARVTYGGGVVALRDVTARAEGGGSLAGRATLRVAERGPGGRGLKVLPPARIRAAFEGTAEDVSLATLPVEGLPWQGSLRLAGRADADFAGQWEGGELAAAANVTVDGLRVGDVPFSTAVARVQADDGAFVLTAARLVSPAGTAIVRGNVDPRGALALDFLLDGLDLARFGAAFGLPELDGFVSAAGSVSGTVAQPRLLVRSLGGMNLRYRTFAADTVTARNVVVTRQGVTLSARDGEQLTVHRYPASVAVTGRVTGLTPRPGGAGRLDPVLDLVAAVRSLDYQEVLRQLPQQTRDRVQDTVRSTVAKRPPSPSEAPRSTPPGGEPAPFSGSVRYATVRVQGRVSDPVVRGDAWLGRLVVAGYPLGRAGSLAPRTPRAPGQPRGVRVPTTAPNVRFAYRDGQISLTDIRVAASVGEVTGKATITRSGYVYGQFGGADLDLGPLTYLTRSVASLSGKVNLSGYFSGTRERPVVTVNVAPSDISVAGTPLSDVTVADLRYIANLSQNQARVELREASFRQNGTTVRVGRTAYDIKSRRLDTRLSVDTGDVGVLLESLRRSGLVDTPAGARFVAALNGLPYPIEGKFPVMEVTFTGRVGQKIEDVNATARLRAEGVRIGTFVASQFAADATMKGDVVTLGQVTVTSGDTTFLASGTVDLDGPLNLSIDSNDEASLELVQAFVPSFPVRGKVSLNALVQGTYQRPEVTASLTGTDLLFVLAPDEEDVARAAQASEARIAEAARQASPVTDPNAVAPEREALQQVLTQAENPRGIRFSRLRAEGIRLWRGEDGAPVLEIPSVLISREEGAEVRVSGRLPVTYGADRPPRAGREYPVIAIDANRPLDLEAVVPEQDLGLLVGVAREAGVDLTGEGEAAPQPEVGGRVAGRVSLRGSLARPQLGGGLDVTDGSLRLPPVNGREVFNPVRDFQLRLALVTPEDPNEPPRIEFQRGELTLGAPGGGGGAHGTLTLAGSVEVRDLRDLLDSLGNGRVLANGTPDGGASAGFGSGTRFDLTLTAKELRPVATNLLRRGEAFQAKIDGEVRITGSLRSPLIATPEGRALEIRDARIQLPTLPGPEPRPRDPGMPNPRFDMQVTLANKATVENASLLRFAFDAEGDVRMRGSLSQPDVTGEFETLGGFLQYFTARFRVQKGGEFGFRLAGGDAYLTFEDVVATATSSRTLRGDQRVRERYKITARLNGRLNLGETVDTGEIDPSTLLTLSADPFLSQQDIIGVIGSRDQFEAAARGDIGLALRSGFEQVLSSGFLPGVLAPIEERLAFSLGLEEFAVDYAPDAPLTLRLSKRFSEPFDRFLVSYSRSLSDGGRRPGEPLPFTLGLLYEFAEVRANRRYAPRISVGVSTDEQRDHTVSLRATVNY